MREGERERARRERERERGERRTCEWRCVVEVGVGGRAVGGGGGRERTGAACGRVWEGKVLSVCQVCESVRV